MVVNNDTIDVEGRFVGGLSMADEARSRWRIQRNLLTLICTEDLRTVDLLATLVWMIRVKNS
jgi:hypothetical protein